MDRATEAEDLMAKIRALNGEEGSENLSTTDRAGISPGLSAKGSSAADGSGLADSSPSSFGVDGSRRRRPGDSALPKGPRAR